MENKRRKMNTKYVTRKRRKRFVSKVFRIAFATVGIGACFMIFYKIYGQEIGSLSQILSLEVDEEYDEDSDEVVDNKDFESNSKEHDLDKQLKLLAQDDSDIKTLLDNREEYPDEILYLFVKNNETKQFVLDYPTKKNDMVSIDISGEVEEENVPLFLQWDERWGYAMYGDEIMAIDGCGPTCLSMVAVSILEDTSMNPYWMAQYSEEKGFVSSNVTQWSLMSEGAMALGLDVTEIPLNEQRVADNLNVGNPIICIMGPGDFTTSGHFIVLTNYEDGMVTVNDPNSIARSKMEWSFEEISSQIRNLWVYR